jgi:hypothetical protein
VLTIYIFVLQEILKKVFKLKWTVIWINMKKWKCASENNT